MHRPTAFLCTFLAISTIWPAASTAAQHGSLTDTAGVLALVPVWLVGARRIRVVAIRVGYRLLDDQWIAAIRHPSVVRTSTINSAPTESMERPRNCPRVRLVELAQATSPRVTTRGASRALDTARAN